LKLEVSDSISDEELLRLHSLVGQKVDVSVRSQQLEIDDVIDEDEAQTNIVDFMKG